jgi:hypothetical protein
MGSLPVHKRSLVELVLIRALGILAIALSDPANGTPGMAFHGDSCWAGSYDRVIPSF